MRNKADFCENSTASEIKCDRSERQASMDPDLRVIRSVIDPDQNGQAVEQAGPAQPEEDLIKQDGHAQSSPRPDQTISLAQRVLGFAISFIRRPDAPRLLACLFLLTFVLLEPGFMLFLFVMSLLAVPVLYFSFGPDRIETWVINRYKSLRERDLDAAERIRLRAARASKWLSGIIEKFPEKWSDGLYLPDFDEPAELPEKFKTDPFDRLARQ